MNPSDIVKLGRTAFMDSYWQNAGVEWGIYAVVEWVAKNHNTWRELKADEKDACHQVHFGKPYTQTERGPAQAIEYGFDAVTSFEQFKLNYPNMKI